MANKLYISEMSNGVTGIGTYIAQILPQPSMRDQIVAVGGASTQSLAFTAKTQAVLLCTDTACCIAFGDDPVALQASSWLLPANTPIAFAVAPGTKVACITP